MQRVEVELSGELADYSVWLMWLAYIKAWSQVHAMAGAHERIAAQCLAESIDIRVRPLVARRHAPLCRRIKRVIQRLSVKPARRRVGIL